MIDKQTIQLNGQTYERSNGGCADCDLDEVGFACFNVSKLLGGGCCDRRCWKAVNSSICGVDNVVKEVK